jgi:hypothetical protein
MTKIFSLLITVIIITFVNLVHAENSEITLEFGRSLPLFGNRKPYQSMVGGNYRKPIKDHYYIEAGVQHQFDKRTLILGHTSFGVAYKNVSAGIGVGAIDRTTVTLGTHLELVINVRMTFEPILNMYLSCWHISNGKAILNHTKKPNVGENFITLGYIFKL